MVSLVEAFFVINFDSSWVANLSKDFSKLVHLPSRTFVYLLPIAPSKIQLSPNLTGILLEKSSRPSLRWLRNELARRTIPFIKIAARASTKHGYRMLTDDMTGELNDARALNSICIPQLIVDLGFSARRMNP